MLFPFASLYAVVKEQSLEEGTCPLLFATPAPNDEGNSAFFLQQLFLPQIGC